MTDELRVRERESLRRFVASCPFAGDVLDYGCGLAPYRDIVEASGARWHGVDSPGYPASVLREEPVGWPGYLVGDSPFTHGEHWDAILCTQVIQYVQNPFALLTVFHRALAHLDAGLKAAPGRLILTGPTNWPVVEPQDLWRYTPAGIRELLTQVGYTVERLVPRASIPSPGGAMLLGWGVVASPRTS